MSYVGKIDQNVIYRIERVPEIPVDYPYLVVSCNANKSCDICTVDNLQTKNGFNMKFKKGTGVEVTITSARKLDSNGVAKWFKDLKHLYLFCKSSHCQFILSSGATFVNELVSGACFDAILKSCEIDPQEYWYSINNWLESKLTKRALT